MLVQISSILVLFFIKLFIHTRLGYNTISVAIKFVFSLTEKALTQNRLMCSIFNYIMVCLDTFYLSKFLNFHICAQQNFRN